MIFSQPTRLVLLRFVAISLVMLCLTWLLAEVSLIGPRQARNEWQREDRADSYEHWRAVLKLYEFAASLKPMDSVIPLEQTYVLAWGTTLPTTTSEQIKQLRKHAIEDLEDAIQWRPTWGAGWASLSLLYIQTGRPIEETISAYRRAMQLAWTEGIFQSQLLYVGLLLWDLLSDDERQNLERMVQFMLLNNPDQLIDVVVLLYKEEWLLPFVSDYPQQLRYLESQLAQRNQPQSQIDIGRKTGTK